jgi:hypothetical protein
VLSFPLRQHHHAGERGMTKRSAHSRALSFLLPVSPDARGVNFSSTTEKQHDQGTDGR